MKILTVKQKLYQGLQPEQLGAERIGAGVQKAAYSLRVDYYGELVIKLASGGYRDDSKRPPKAIKKYDARAPFMWFVKGWCIQEKVKQITNPKTGNVQVSKQCYEKWRKLYAADLGDMHEYNCGEAENGDLVVFDW